MSGVATNTAAAVVALLVAGTAAQAGSGRHVSTVPPAQDYMLNCRGCHGADGRGAPGHVPTLVGLDRLLTTPQGRAYVVQVPGVSHVGISHARVAALLNWTLDKFGDCRFAPYTADEVAQLRSTAREPGNAADPSLVRAAVGSALLPCKVQ